jgi:hypothetical protein
MVFDNFKKWYTGIINTNGFATTNEEPKWSEVNANNSATLIDKTQIGGFTSVFVNHVDPATGDYEGWLPVEVYKHNLLTNNGRDYFIQQVYTNSVSGSAGMGSIYIALAENSGAPVVADTVVSGEVSGGLTRTSGDTITHTPGTNTAIIQKTFTATNPYSGLQKSGLFNNPTGATLTHQNTFTPTALSSGDQIQVQWTLTLG